MASRAPDVRKVRLRLEGDDADVLAVNDLLQFLPGLSHNRAQIGQASEPYDNRRGGGVRRYVDVYLVDDTATSATTATPSATTSTELQINSVEPEKAR